MKYSVLGPFLAPRKNRKLMIGWVEANDATVRGSNLSHGALKAKNQSRRKGLFLISQPLFYQSKNAILFKV